MHEAGVDLTEKKKTPNYAGGRNSSGTMTCCMREKTQTIEAMGTSWGAGLSYLRNNL